MFCSHCGSSVNADDSFCPKCGAPLKQQETHYVNHSQVVEVKPKPKQDNTLSTVAKVFLVISCVTTGLTLIGIIGLAWMVPLTVIYFNKVSRGEQVSVGLKIACLLLVSLVAGICMLCDNEH